MIEVIQDKEVKSYKRQEVPNFLVKEVLEGKPCFYPGYRKVFSG